MKKSFSTLDITRILQIPRERLRSWMKEGYIKPSVLAHGRGTKAEFTIRDVYVVAIFESLLNRGIKRITASVLISRLLKEDRQLAQDYFVIRYGDEKESIHINTFSSKAVGIDLTTGGMYRPSNQHDNYLQKDKAGNPLPFMPFNQRNQTPVFNSTDDWDCLMILNIAGIKDRIDKSIVKTMK